MVNALINEKHYLLIINDKHCLFAEVEITHLAAYHSHAIGFRFNPLQWHFSIESNAAPSYQ